MAHADGTIVPAEVAPVAAACGQTPEQVRSCLRRLVAEGLFERQGRGADARYVATPAGRAALQAEQSRSRFAYGQDEAGQSWDGRWRLVAFAVPESQRSARNALRDRLLSWGGAGLQPGLYVSPHRWHDAVRAEADSLGVGGALVLAEADRLDVGDTTNPRQLAAALWPVDDLAKGYAAFVERWSWALARLDGMEAEGEVLTDERFLPGALAMALDYEEAARRDPLLPPELLPRPWPGRDARRLMLAVRRAALGVRVRSHAPKLFALFDVATAGVPAPVLPRPRPVP